jgi:uncharacterized protein
MAIAYYGVKLSDNWIETPEGYVIFKNAVIGRTGFQKYKGSELNQEELEQQGITVEPEEEVELYRSDEEVFSPKTIASFETKSITDGHPENLLNLDTVKQHEEGQITNVRKGTEPLDSGDWPLLADLVVKSRNLIDKIKAGLRELSCGYNYHVLKQGNLLLQVDIIGNHVAIVRNGRAGIEASIKDSLDTLKGAFNMSAFLDRLLNKPTKSRITAWAKDAKPEEIADAMDALVSEVEKKEEAKDAEHKADCDCAACKDKAANSAKDAKMKDRQRYYDALDRMLDGKEEEMNAADADMEELKTMFSGAGKGKDETVEGEQNGKEMPEEPIKDESLEALTIEPADRTESSGAGTDSAAYKAGAVAVFKALKPHIAASKDKKLIGAFDTAVRIVAATPAGGTKGGYVAVAKAASTVGKDAVEQKKTAEVKAIVEIEAAYGARKNQRN